MQQLNKESAKEAPSAGSTNSFMSMWKYFYQIIIHLAQKANLILSSRHLFKQKEKHSSTKASCSSKHKCILSFFSCYSCIHNKSITKCLQNKSASYTDVTAEKKNSTRKAGKLKCTVQTVGLSRCSDLNIWAFLLSLLLSRTWNIDVPLQSIQQLWRRQ